MVSPTALNKHGNKVYYKDWIFDSEKEFKFFKRFIEGKVENFKVHPKFMLKPLVKQGEFNSPAISYKPDVVTYDNQGNIKHVYDVKNGFTVYSIDPGVKLRFTLFASQYGIPVEAVVVRTHDFKVIGFGTTKTRKTSNPCEALIVRNTNYDWRESLKI